jgi:hypothetical protein
MNLDFVREVWDAMRSHIDFNERTEAADTLINLLIDNNYETDDIKEAFRGDTEMLKALKGYVDQHDEDELLEYDEETDDDEW